MVWDVPDYLWEENFSAAVRYHKKHGDLNVPTQYVDSEGFRLGQWLAFLRTSRKKGTDTLTEEQKSRLDGLGMIWDNRNDKLWNDSFKALCDYFNEYKKLDIPENYKSKNGIALNSWLQRQKVSFTQGKLSKEREEKLREIGVDFDSKNQWEKRFEYAKEYYEKYGNLDISSDYCIDGCRLRNWLSRQKRKTNLTAQQTEKLKSIGLLEEKSASDRVWDKRFELAKKYYEEYGNLDVPKDYLADNFQLGVWVYNQKKRRQNGELSDEQIKRLSKIGMEWDNTKERKNARLYEIGFEHLEQFISENGVEKIRATTVCKDGYKLGNWVMNCRAKYRRGKLAEEYAVRFEELGVSLTAQKKS
jgi:hypothetical protein